MQGSGQHMVTQESAWLRRRLHNAPCNRLHAWPHTCDLPLATPPPLPYLLPVWGLSLAVYNPSASRGACTSAVGRLYTQPSSWSHSNAEMWKRRRWTCREQHCTDTQNDSCIEHACMLRGDKKKLQFSRMEESAHIQSLGTNRQQYHMNSAYQHQNPVKKKASRGSRNRPLTSTIRSNTKIPALLKTCGFL